MLGLDQRRNIGKERRRRLRVATAVTATTTATTATATRAPATALLLLMRMLVQVRMLWVWVALRSGIAALGLKVRGGRRLRRGETRNAGASSASTRLLRLASVHQPSGYVDRRDGGCRKGGNVARIAQ